HPAGDKPLEVTVPLGGRSVAARSATRRRRLLYVAFSLVTLLLVSPFRLGVVYGRSMDPTLKPGEFCILDRWYYTRQPVRRGDIIVFRNGDEVLTKRVFARPGDTITLIRYPEDGTYEVPTARLDKLRRVSGNSGAALRVVSLRMAPD